MDIKCPKGTHPAGYKCVTNSPPPKVDKTAFHVPIGQAKPPEGDGKSAMEKLNDIPELVLDVDSSKVDLPENFTLTKGERAPDVRAEAPVLPDSQVVKQNPFVREGVAPVAREGKMIDVQSRELQKPSTKGGVPDVNGDGTYYGTIEQPKSYDTQMGVLH